MTTSIEEYRRKVDERVASGDRPPRPACLMDGWGDVKMSRHAHQTRLHLHRKSVETRIRKNNFTRDKKK